MREQSKGFLKQAAIISFSTLIVKLIGVLFKIPLNNIMGSDFGIFSAAYSIFAMLFAISSSGLPSAASKMIARSVEQGKPREVKRIFTSAFFTFGSIGLLASFFLFAFADDILTASNHQDSILAMQIIAPNLFFIGIVSAVRGYFQGFRNTIPTAISQLIEALSRFIIGIGGLLFARKMGYSPSVQAAYAISGLTIGTVISTFYLIWYKLRSDKKGSTIVPPKTKKSASYKAISINLIYIALPVTITAGALYFSQFLDTLVIKNRLISSGVAQEVAQKLYSAYTGLSTSLADILPSTLVFPIAISILPVITAAITKRDKKSVHENMYYSLRISGILALPCSFYLAVLARPVIAMIYGSKWGVSPIEGTKMAIDYAAPALSILSVGIFFLSMVSTTSALLQASKKIWLPVKSSLIGAFVLIIAEIVLVSIKPIGILGAAIATLLSYSVTAFLNFKYLRKTQKYTFSTLKLFFKPLICSAVSGGFCYAAYKICLILFKGAEDRLSCFIILAISCIVAVLSYIILMLKSESIKNKEILMLPFGAKISRYLISKGLLVVKNEHKRINPKRKL